ncbi:thioesterase II family protein [Streptomyces sp. NPDC091268]|uniref:thioesterase II family protein n=1 Tax=Streptomyces sp. NPDC091268 TaxID=3365979 RepID=UPI0037F58B4B
MPAATGVRPRPAPAPAAGPAGRTAPAAPAAYDAQDASRWFRRHGRGPAPRIRLVCFPHAGGAASLYRDWPDLLPAGIEVLAARYPGRQDRFHEPCVETMAELADRITAALRPYLGTPLALFGHSLGSDVAFEVARRLETRHGAGVERIFVSGAAAAHVGDPVDLGGYTDAQLVAEMDRLASPGTGIMADPELAALLLPSLRADYRLSAAYRPTLAELGTVSAPLTAFIGDDDPLLPPSDALSWAQLTTGGFTHRVLPGGHFYLEEPQQRAALLRQITAALLPAA